MSIVTVPFNSVNKKRVARPVTRGKTQGLEFPSYQRGVTTAQVPYLSWEGPWGPVLGWEPV